MTRIRLPLVVGGGHHLRLDRDGERWRASLRHDQGDRRSLLHLALRHHLELRLEGTALRFDADHTVALPGDGRLEVWLGRKGPRRIGAVSLRGEDLHLVEPPRTLSPFEARFLARNGYPAPPERQLTLQTDLHTHLAGCVSAEELVAIGRATGVRYPAALLAEVGVHLDPGDVGPDGAVELAALREDLTARLLPHLAIPLERRITFADMERIYRVRRPLTKHPPAFVPLLRQTARDYQEMGVRYVELSVSEVVRADRLREIHAELPAIEEETGVTVRFLAALSRHDDLEWDLDLIDRIKELAPSPYLVGVDFMGHETNSTRAFLPQLEALGRWASEAKPGFVVRVHAGENPAHPENVRVAVEALRPYDVTVRVGHGLFGVGDETVDLLRELGVVVEFNLDSNFALNNIQGPHEVPLLRYVRAGVPCVLGTDGYGIYQTTLAQVARAAALAGLGPDDLAAVQAAERAYVAARRTWAAGLPDPVGWAIPDDPPNRHYTPAVEARKAEAVRARRAAMDARLAEIGAAPLEAEPFRELLRTRRCLSVAGAWRSSWARLEAHHQDQVRRLFADVFGELDPEELVVLTGGTALGVEHVVQQAARARGFTVVGTLVEETPPETLGPDEVTHVTRISRAVHEKAAALYRLVQEHDGVALFVGGGNVVSDEIRTACNLGVKVLLVDGPPGASTDHARMQPQRAVTTSREVLEALAGEARWRAAPEPYWHLGPNQTADTVLTRRNPRTLAREVLLIRRADDAPVEGGKWALPGGFVPTDAPRGTPWVPGRETAAETALRELHEEAGLDLRDLRDRLVHVGDYEGEGRDPRDTDQAWSRSSVYALELPDALATLPIAGGDDACDARWVALDALPWNLAFDHARILSDALRLQRRTTRLRLGALDLDEE